MQFEHKRLGKAGVFMKKALPIGYDNFKRIISDELFYVDKTMIIKELHPNTMYPTARCITG